MTRRDHGTASEPTGTGDPVAAGLARAPVPAPRGVALLVAEGQNFEREGRHVEARGCYERALRRGVGGAPDEPSPSALLRWVARTHHAEGRADVALEVLEVARLAAEGDADIGQADNLHAVILYQQGALDAAAELFNSAREAAARSGDERLVAMTANNLAVIANIRGDLAFALGRYESALAAYRALGMVRDVCVALNNLGMLHVDLQQWDAAESRYSEASHIARTLGEHELQLLLEGNMAELAIARGDLAAAREACARGRALLGPNRDGQGAGEIEKLSGVLAREAGDAAAAEAHFAAAARLAEERQALLLAAETAREWAELYRRQGRNAAMLQQLNFAHRAFGQLKARRDLADVDRRTARLEDEFLEVARRWGSSIESKDRYTQGHCERVAAMGSALAGRAGIEERSLFWFRVGALLHDVGKLIIPAEVLNKPGRLDEEEWVLMRRHPQAGVELLADIDFPWDVRPIVLSHHERWDGKGYPHKLAGDAIPLTARILTIVDVYDALTTARSYKHALPQDEALEIMRQDAGLQFDPALFALFEQLCAEGLPVVPERDEAPAAAVAAPSRGFAIGGIARFGATPSSVTRDR